MRTAGTLLRQRLADQREALRVAEAAVRNGEPQGLHDLRVAMRRIRSALATFRPILDRSVTEPLREELKWASGRLGEARDADVATDLTDQLIADADLAGLEDEAVTGLRARLRIDAAAAADVVDETLDSPRYAATSLLLDALVSDPPLNEKAEREARTVARKRVRHEVRRVAERLVEARMPVDPSDPEAPYDHNEHVTRLHGVRKAAKRLRYAAETARPVTGKRIKRLGKQAKRVQSVLGDHHDAVITRATLRHLAVDEASGEAAAFLLGHLDADEQRATRKLEERAWRQIGALEEHVARDE
ncbi:CHAD domain-containing protein [Terrabacter sp. MAHUQ-38]|uniref:CHAD domain-containing protein n=1 Tax=unclassified Terrabacter TaxID=2630222 RepID=UPI00165E5662|nr:CHAD domain-containing protein [Terrabacter sp. MAHUQ-38]MBC9820462.1 CHAD domain-containing protein [Terrabacter sp. MAHUQ-38]